MPKQQTCWRRRSAVVVVGGLAVSVLAAPSVASAAGDDRVAIVVPSAPSAGDLRVVTVQADGAQRRDISAPGVRLTDVEWSPDGSELAALARPFGGGPTSVRVLAQDGSAQRTLATDASDASRVKDGLAWTNDGSHLGYISGRPDSTRLSIVRRDGGARTVLDTRTRDMQVLQWSPTGKQVTFTSRAPNGSVSLFGAEPTGGEGLDEIGDEAGTPQAPRGLTFSPDGLLVAYLFNAADGQVRPRIASFFGGAITDQPPQRSLIRPEWSPDGATVAIPRFEGVGLLDPESRQERPLGFTPPDGQVVSGFGGWSPDSDHVLVLTSSPEQPAAQQIWVVEVATGQGRRLDAGVGVEHATFAPLPTTPPARRTTSNACEGAPSAGFSDTAGHAFEAEIDCVAWYDVARGTSEDTYSPGAAVSRAQMAQFLTRVAAQAGAPLDTSDAGFTDLGDLSQDARDAVNAVAHLGVALGSVDPGRFVPAAPVTRAQMASFLARLHQALSGEEVAGRVHCFADVSFDFHRPAIEQLCGAGVTTGASRGVYDPSASVTRAQMAGFLARLLDIEVEAGLVTRPG